MRSHPSCWNKTLAKLGFKRKIRKASKRQDLLKRRSLFENLEQRQMLAADLYTVTTATDIAVAGTTSDDLWSLREALAHSAADTEAGTDRIEFSASLANATLELTNQLIIDSDVEIIGLGADRLTIDADGETTGSRAFFIDTAATAKLEGLSITGGKTNSGAGIFSRGDLTLTDVTVANNEATAGGGGVYSTSAGRLTLRNTTIDSNTAKFGGGIYGFFAPGESLVIESSTLSHNVADLDGIGSGGGIFFKNEGISQDAQARITNTTFSGNSAATHTGAIRITGDTNSSAATDVLITNATITENVSGTSNGGGLIVFNNAEATLHNTIVAGNTTSQGAANDIHGTLSLASSHNLIGTGGSGGLTSSNGNQVDVVDAGLTSLGNYGGPTATHALLPTSSAIDAGSDNAADGLLTDQRGYQRNFKIDFPSLVGNSVDVGAYEYGIVVTTTTDENDGDLSPDDLSLREALALATANSGEHIQFSPALLEYATSATIELNSQLIIDSNVEIIGLGADRLTIDANGETTGSRAFLIRDDVTAAIKDLTITGGKSNGGGGILNYGDLTVEQVTVVGNETNGSGGGINTKATGSLTLLDSTIGQNLAKYGGGIYGVFGVGESLVILGSTISNNQANQEGVGSGGGLMYVNNDAANHAAQARIANSTFSGNSALLATGGLRLFGNSGSSVTTEISIVNTTITNNMGPAGGGLLAGTNADVTLHNTIVAGNLGAGVANDVYGTLNSTSSHNLIGTGGSGELTTINGNLIEVVDPGLLPLANYGGPTQTHALLAESSAIDAGSDVASQTLTTDQRGFERKIDYPGTGVDAVDIGATESLVTIVVTTAVDENDPNPENDLASLSLREALAIAVAKQSQSPSRISFDPSLAYVPLLVNSELLISSDVEIVGLGTNQITINAASNVDDPANQHRVFHITDSDSKVTISELTITGGYAFHGGGILNEDATLTLQNVNIIGNDTPTDPNSIGDGIANINGTVQILGGVISDNTSLNGGGIYTFGGSLTLAESAGVGTQVVGNESASGGGFMGNNSDVTLIGATIGGVRRSADRNLPKIALCLNYVRSLGRIVFPAFA